MIFLNQNFNTYLLTYILLNNLMKGLIPVYNDRTDLVTIDELCEILMIGKNTAYSLLKRGAIKSFKINRVWKIPRISVDEYIKKQAQIN